MFKNRFSGLCLVACAPIAISSRAAAAEQSIWRISSGVSYSKGDYGDISATKVLAIPVSLTYRRAGLRLRVSLPWVRITGPGSLIQTPEGRDVGGGGVATGGSGGGSNSGPGSGGSGGSGGGPGPSGGGGGGGDVGTSAGTGTGSGTGGTPAPNRRSGLGDLNVGATYSFDIGGKFYVEPGVKVKLPTASRSRRIGTGKTDVTVSADLVKEVGDATFYAGARRRFTGKPAGSTLRSTWGAGAGASVSLSRTLLLGADYDWQQSSTRSRGPSSELTGWASTRLTRRARLTVSGTAGFTSSSADWAGAAIISWRL